MAVDVTGGGAPKASFWRDQRNRAIFTQVVVISLFVWLVWFIVDNTLTNLARQGIEPGFDFMSDIAGFMPTSPSFNITNFNVEESTYSDVFWLGLVNTLLVSICGIFFATIIGLIFGVLRLSSNVLISFVAAIYIEVTRNVPLLLQILIWYFGVFLALPNVRSSINIGDVIFLNDRYLTFPSIIPEGGFILFPIAIVFAIGSIIKLKMWAKKRQDETGEQFPVFLASVGLIIGLPLLALIITGFPFSWEVPALKGFNFQGGFQAPAAFWALLAALTFYTGAFIAENVRAGIQAVSHGQTEAAFALGLRPNVTMRKIIIPQALRVIVPPTTSQYLNLTKNSSLAVAVGYPDLVSVFTGTTLNQTGKALEIIALTMLVYLTISLTISLFMNWYNKRIALVER